MLRANHQSINQSIYEINQINEIKYGGLKLDYTVTQK